MRDTLYQRLSVQDRRYALRVAQDKSRRRAFLLEKDIWVVATLEILFGASFAGHLIFKGGTSLSKVWHAIRRFSEDVNITYDIRAFAPDLVAGAGDEALPPTRSQQKRWTRAIRARLLEWVRDQASPIVKEGLARAGFAAEVRAEGDRLHIRYEPLFKETDFVRPVVKVEFGARSTGEPHTTRPVVCDAAAYLPDLAFPETCPSTMLAERTFWEKATAVHVYCCQQRRRGSACRGTGTISRVSTRPGLRRARWPTGRLPFRWPATNRYSSPRTMPVACESTTRPRYQAACNSFLQVPRLRSLLTITRGWWPTACCSTRTSRSMR